MQTLRVDLGQAKCFIKFAVGQQSGVGGDLAPQELELDRKSTRLNSSHTSIP